MAGALHDVVEDTSWSLEDLRREGFSEDVVSAVDALTHRAGEEYFEYVRRAAAHPLARLVKASDVRDNLDTTRIPAMTDRDRERLARYAHALSIVDPEAA